MTEAITSVRRRGGTSLSPLAVELAVVMDPPTCESSPTQPPRASAGSRSFDITTARTSPLGIRRACPPLREERGAQQAQHVITHQMVHHHHISSADAIPSPPVAIPSKVVSIVPASSPMPSHPSILTLPTQIILGRNSDGNGGTSASFVLQATHSLATQLMRSSNCPLGNSSFFTRIKAFHTVSAALFCLTMISFCCCSHNDGWISNQGTHSISPGTTLILGGLLFGMPCRRGMP
jgi:hypothetical protein